MFSSLELSHRDSFNEGAQHTFSMRKKEKLSLNYPKYPLLSGALTYSKPLIQHF